MIVHQLYVFAQWKHKLLIIEKVVWSYSLIPGTLYKHLIATRETPTLLQQSFCISLFDENRDSISTESLCDDVLFDLEQFVDRVLTEAIW